jgi:hypothetical protein
MGGCGSKEIYTESVLDYRRERPEFRLQAAGVIDRFGFQLPRQQQESYLGLGIPPQMVNNGSLLGVKGLVPSAGQRRLIEDAI